MSQNFLFYTSQKMESDTKMADTINMFLYY
jgi:hypothetical protein